MEQTARQAVKEMESAWRLDIKVSTAGGHSRAYKVKEKWITL